VKRAIDAVAPERGDSIVSTRPLHIAVDGRELAGKPTGVGRYLFNILRAWSEDRDQPHRFTVIVPEAAGPESHTLGSRFTWMHEPARSHGTRWEQTRLAQLVGELRPDVFFAAGYTAPLRLRRPYVLAVYDVSFFAHPEWFGVREGFRRRLITRAAARRAHSVITISEFSAQEIERYLRVPRARIHLAPPGVSVSRGTEVDLWKTSGTLNLTPDVFHRSTSVPFVLYAGSLFTRRHIPELIEGFARASARAPAARLVLVGDNRARPPIDPMAIAARLGVADRIDWRRYVSDDELQRLYASARVFAFLSEYEGFGMTPLEALAHDVPLVLLDTSVSREVYGDAARYVRLDATSIGDALGDLLVDDGAHAALRQAGRRRLPHYSWVRSAAVVRTALEAAALPS
jgi:glycosyltransferase involved in cell wall biosynthesis